MNALRKEETYAKDKIYTIEDIEALPEGVRAELIDGQMYYMATPSRTHQRIIVKLCQTIANYIDGNNGECEVYVAPFAVFLTDDAVNYYEPDISVICDVSKIDEKGCHGAPDWIIEIVSPSSKPRDYIKKMLKYCTAGVREYWVVDPEKQRVTVYGFEKDENDEYMFGEYSFGDEIPVGIYKGFSIKVE